MYIRTLAVFLLFTLCAVAQESFYLSFRLDFNETCANVNATDPTLPEPLTIELANANTTIYTIQGVMEIAADSDNRYRFTVTFIDFATGYVIDTILNLMTADDCSWFLFYQAPDELEPQYKPNALISFFVVEPNSTVVLSYEAEPTVPPVPSPSPSPNPPDDNNNGAIPAYSVANSLLAIVTSVVVVLAAFV